MASKFILLFFYSFVLMLFGSYVLLFLCTKYELLQ